jgi:hypothetical protein
MVKAAVDRVDPDGVYAQLLQVGYISGAVCSGRERVDVGGTEAPFSGYHTLDLKLGVRFGETTTTLVSAAWKQRKLLTYRYSSSTHSPARPGVDTQHPVDISRLYSLI